MKSPGILRRLYQWVLSWADKPGSELFLFLLSFSESSFFPIPPGVILIPLVLGNRRKWIRYAVITLIASVLGGVFGYFIGWKLWWQTGVEPAQFSGVARFFFDTIPGFNEEMFWVIQKKYELHNFLIVFTAGFSPIPYKMITISAGAFHINFAVFIIASIISRGGRFFMVTSVVRLFGEKAKVFIEKYLNLLALVLVGLLVAGIFMVKYVF